MGWKKTTAVIFILALIMINVYLFSGLFSNNNKACFRDMCIYGQTENVTKEIKNLVALSNSSIIYAEGDETATQTTSYVDQVFLQLYSDMISANKAPTFVLISLDRNGNAVNCSCETYTRSNSTACVNSSLTYCQSLRPAAKQVMFIIKYPNYVKNEIFISNNTVTIKANSGSSLAGMFEVLRGIIFQ